jgi:hypothetical protein
MSVGIVVLHVESSTKLKARPSNEVAEELGGGVGGAPLSSL